jgi:hypothetical protein
MSAFVVYKARGEVIAVNLDRIEYLVVGRSGILHLHTRSDEQFMVDDEAEVASVLEQFCEATGTLRYRVMEEKK